MEHAKYVCAQRLGRVAILLIAVWHGVPIAAAQSGAGAMHGYVAFDDIAFNDVEHSAVRARVELRSITRGDQSVVVTVTNEHGAYELPGIRMGEYALQITAPGYRTYSTRIYVPSDFICSLATMLKREPGHGRRKSRGHAQSAPN